jgi:DNA-binding PadR family transcriptional regulator
VFYFRKQEVGTMPKDDYFRIVYIILDYLYKCVRTGVGVDDSKIEHKNDRFCVPYSYWEFIIRNMVKDGLVTGYQVMRSGKEGEFLVYQGGLEITSKGIEYLTENTSMQKIMNTLKDIKDITPGL